MYDMFEFVSRWFWAIAIGVTVLNLAIFKIRSVRHIVKNPELADGYATLLRGALFWMNVPWIVMGVGSIIGGVPTVWHYFRPQEANPYVLAWFGSILLWWICGTYWLFFRGGAEMLVKHPGAFRGEISSPTVVKLLWVVSLAGGVFGIIVMWTMNVPLPRFP